MMTDTIVAAAKAMRDRYAGGVPCRRGKDLPDTSTIAG